jgi:SAM-dependent methyltransferase
VRAFEPALAGSPCALELSGGHRVPLPVGRWSAAAGTGDEPLLGACHGPTLDIGCGPGRLTEALVARGVCALGVDSSPVAVRLTRARGVLALHRNVFDPLPAEGRWHHALLADGNIGIGGDPVALLHRVRELLRPDGTVLVEVDPPGGGLRTGRARLRGDGIPGRWFGWANVGADALGMVAAAAGLRVRWLVARSDRWFAEMGPRSSPPGTVDQASGPAPGHHEPAPGGGRSSRRPVAAPGPGDPAAGTHGSPPARDGRA